MMVPVERLRIGDLVVEEGRGDSRIHAIFTAVRRFYDVHYVDGFARRYPAGAQIEVVEFAPASDAEFDL